MTPEIKKGIIEKYATHEGDTGSPEVQIAILTYRINNLTEHLKSNDKVITAAADFLKWSDTEETCWVIS